MPDSLVSAPILDSSNLSTALQSLRHVGDQSELLTIKLTYRADAASGVRLEYYLLKLLMHLSHSLKQCF